MDDDPTAPGAPESKLTATKQKWAEARKFLTGRHARPETERLPPGQHLVRDWPVLDLGLQPEISRQTWTLDVDGLVATPLHLDWAGFEALPQSREVSDIHCVTTWSRYDNQWDGVRTADLLAAVQPTAEAAFVELHAFDGYTTNLPLADFAVADAMIVHSWDGAPLSRAHGGPARLVVPHLYFWKSAKWINRITFLPADRLGFWEVRGYHERGDPWAEERYSE